MRTRGQAIGLLIGLVVETITMQDVSWRPLSIFAFAAVGFFVGDLAERIWRGQLGTSKWSFSLRTLLILTILGPPALAWAWFKWQAWERDRREPAYPARTIEEILRGSPDSRDT